MLVSYELLNNSTLVRLQVQYFGLGELVYRRQQLFFGQFEGRTMGLRGIELASVQNSGTVEDGTIV